MFRYRFTKSAKLSCAGQATSDGYKHSFEALPVSTCLKIVGGSTKASG